MKGVLQMKKFWRFLTRTVFKKYWQEDIGAAISKNQNKLISDVDKLAQLYGTSLSSMLHGAENKRQEIKDTVVAMDQKNQKAQVYLDERKAVANKGATLVDDIFLLGSRLSSNSR